MPKTTTKAKSKAKTKPEQEEVKVVNHKGKYFHASGKRKTSIARVRLHKGTGEISVNEKPVNEYFVLKIGFLFSVILLGLGLRKVVRGY